MGCWCWNTFRLPRTVPDLLWLLLLHKNLGQVLCYFLRAVICLQYYIAALAVCISNLGKLVDYYRLLCISIIMNFLIIGSEYNRFLYYRLLYLLIITVVLVILFDNKDGVYYRLLYIIDNNCYAYSRFQ